MLARFLLVFTMFLVFFGFLVPSRLPFLFVAFVLLSYIFVGSFFLLFFKPRFSAFVQIAHSSELISFFFVRLGFFNYC